ncbi:MAG: hypothetical protein M1833_006999 [Piccolia ochrophora]|nr:MAG: hypothetical protein M1833_006999 [Piccolia ochrophora]
MSNTPGRASDRGTQLRAPRAPGATPRHSNADDPSLYTPKETPYSNLRQLAGLIQRPSTPPERPSSAAALSTRRSARRTPSVQARGPSRPTPSRRGAPTTPHAIRALQQRRAAALTPGRDRRRSGRLQRETPRDLLRNLSRVLAPATRQVDRSPEAQLAHEKASPFPHSIDFDDEPDLPAPRMSMRLDEDDDDEDDSLPLPPPRLSIGLDDENDTQRSVEMPRRAYSEQPGRRFSRDSFGGLRLSDRFADLNELGRGTFIGDDDEDSVIRPDIGDYDANESEEQDISMGDGTMTRELQQAFFEDDRQTRSALQPHELQDEFDDTTFMLAVPQADARDSSPLGPTLNDSTHAFHAPSAQVSVHEKTRAKKQLKLSRHGTPYPSLPTTVVKKMAATFAQSGGQGKAKIHKDTLALLMQASDWFLEQISDDLGAYARHAGRTTIEESDMVTLMRRYIFLD